MTDLAEARHHICNLLYRYAEALDAGDLETLKAMFRHAKLYAGSRDRCFEGEEGVAQMFEDIVIYYDDEENIVPYGQGTPRTHHVITNPIIEAVADNPDQLQARSRFTVFQQLKTLPLQAIIAGGYTDIFEKADGTWRFAERMYRTALSGDVSQHIKGFERFDPSQ